MSVFSAAGKNEDCLREFKQSQPLIPYRMKRPIYRVKHGTVLLLQGDVPIAELLHPLNADLLQGVDVQWGRSLRWEAGVGLVVVDGAVGRLQADQGVLWSRVRRRYCLPFARLVGPCSVVVDGWRDKSQLLEYLTQWELGKMPEGKVRRA